MSNQPIFSFAPAPVRNKPFDHVLVDNFIAREYYDELVRTFPKCPPSTGPTGYSLYWGDPAYEELITTNPAWRTLFESAQSQGFVDYCVATFRETFKAASVDVGRATYVSFRETREDKERRHILEPKHEPHELWVRLDIHQALPGYHRVKHVDHRRRLVSMLIYLCDADECGMVGGDLVLHGKQQSWWERFTTRDAVVRPRHNLMAAFPCYPASIHSVPEIVKQNIPRNYLQLHVSSSYDAWPS